MVNLQWEELLDNDKSTFLVQCRERDIDIFAACNKGEAVSRIVRGKNCGSISELFHEFSAALQFPYYFGNNWDALDDCLSDLAWLKSDKIVLFITNADAH